MSESIYKVPDRVGNLYRDTERKGCKYDKGGKLLEDGSWHYYYNAEGFLVQKTSKERRSSGFNLFAKDDSLTPYYTFFYSWYANGQLRSVRDTDGLSQSFEYDALGRRTAKLDMRRMLIRRFLWDGNVPLHEWEYDVKKRPKPVVNELGELTYNHEEPCNKEELITWIFNEGSFSPTAKFKGENKYSIISDYLGTPYQMYDADGTLIWDCELDIYGKVRRLAKGSLSDCPFRYQGQYEDIETGLYYNRFRYYDPSTGIFTQKDPIGLAGNMPNMYSYVADSNSWVDPFGLLGAEALAAAQKMGAEAEVIAQNKYGFTKNTDFIDSIKQGRRHIPDGMTNTDIYEVKCVKKQGYTRQIKSYVATGKNVTVIVDTDTKLSKVLKQAELDGKLKIERTDLKNRPKKISCG